MDDDIREFVLSTLKDLNYDVNDVTGDTDLGPNGLDLESLAIAELAVLAEDHFGIAFSDEIAEEMALMTLDEFITAVGSRVSVPAGEKQE